MQKSLIFIFFLLVAKALSGSGNPNQKQVNVFSFSDREKRIDHELDLLTPLPFKTHPDFGNLPYDSPCENCMELEER